MWFFELKCGCWMWVFVLCYMEVDFFWKIGFFWNWAIDVKGFNQVTPSERCRLWMCLKWGFQELLIEGGFHLRNWTFWNAQLKEKDSVILLFRKNLIQCILGFGSESKCGCLKRVWVFWNNCYMKVHFIRKDWRRRIPIDWFLVLLKWGCWFWWVHW